MCADLPRTLSHSAGTSAPDKASTSGATAAVACQLTECTAVDGRCVVYAGPMRENQRRSRNKKLQ